MDEHFRPDAGLELDDYVRAGDTNAVWHLIREAPRASRRGDLGALAIHEPLGAQDREDREVDGR